MYEINLAGKNAIITGGARGLGRASADMLAKCGANTWIVDILESGEEAAREISAEYGVRTGFSKADVTEVDMVASFFNDAESLGTLDILVHAAGIMENGSALDTDPAYARRIADVNLVGSFYVLTAGVRRMIPNRRGKIVAFSSIAGRRGVEIAGHYSATKAGVINYVRALSVESGPYGINVNSICPGNINTEMFVGMASAKAEAEGISIEESLAYFNKPVPLGRPAEPEEVAGVVLFLCSDLADYITGQALNVCGGLVQS